MGGTFSNLARGFWELVLPAVDAFAMRGARLAAVPLVALLVAGTVWKGTSIYFDQSPLPGTDQVTSDATTSDVPANAPATNAPVQRTTRSLLSQPGPADTTAVQRGGAAEEALKRDIAAKEAALGPNHPDVAGMVVDLADLYQSQGRYRDAEALYDRALAIRKRALGPTHPDVARTLEQLSLVQRAQGRVREADQLSERAQAIRESRQSR
jgi:hypothetical protein